VAPGLPVGRGWRTIPLSWRFSDTDGKVITWEQKAIWVIITSRVMSLTPPESPPWEAMILLTWKPWLDMESWDWGWDG